jgi:serine protease DegQ
LLGSRHGARTFPFAGEAVRPAHVARRAGRNSLLRRTVDSMAGEPPPMKRATLYSTSSRTLPRAGKTPAEAAPSRAAEECKPAERRLSRWRDLYKRHEKLLLCAGAALFAAALVWAHAALTPAPRELTQEDIDAAVAHALESRPLPAPAIKAYGAVRNSIVRVRAIGDGLEQDEYAQRAVGTGVVIIDRGVILTSLHVVSGASRIRVQFVDGLESDATVVSTQPENDLAVVQAKEIPDDLQAATLRSAKELVEGEHVTAVGFPFGIGPSVSSGVISGLQREYRSADGARSLTNLIQFDAAVNPGSSGGPLVNAAGEVIGIVTAILSPTGTFSGIAFAVPIETAAAAAGLPPF